MMFCGRRQSGFTLLELLVAMSMVAVLSLSLYASLRIAFKAKESALRGIGPVRASGLAMDLVRQDLESALPPTGLLAGAFLGDVDGGNSFVEFYASGEGLNVEDFTGQGSVRKVELGVTALPDGRNNVLVRRLTTNLLAPQVIEPEEEILCRGVRLFTLRYWDGLDWIDTWDSTTLGDVLPGAVEVTLEIAWPPDSTDPEKTYRTTRIFTLACNKEIDEEALATGGVQ